MANANPKVQLKDVTLMWANLDTQNSMSGKYQVDLTNLSPDDCEKVKALGLTIKSRADRPEKGAFLTPKSTFPIVPLDKNGSPVKGSVGNGTKADVLLSYYMLKKRPPGAADRSPTILKLVITDMVEYVPEPQTDDTL